jgi:hypothetical protein
LGKLRRSARKALNKFKAQIPVMIRPTRTVSLERLIEDASTSVKPPRVLTKLEGTALRPNFIARRAHSNLLVLVRNKHPPAAAHDGKGLGEVIDEGSDGRQHAPGRREDQVDDALRRAPFRQEVDERAAADNWRIGAPGEPLLAMTATGIHLTDPAALRSLHPVDFWGAVVLL